MTEQSDENDYTSTCRVCSSAHPSGTPCGSADADWDAGVR